MELELLKSGWNLKKMKFLIEKNISTQMQECHIVVKGGSSYCEGCIGRHRGVGCGVLKTPDR